MMIFMLYLPDDDLVVSSINGARAFGWTFGWNAVQQGRARLAMIPIENSTAGRVADIHILLPGSGLYIIGEHFEAIRHCLLGVKGTDASMLKTVKSHVQALGQCRKNLRALGLERLPFADSAGSPKHVAELGDVSVGAIASALLAEVYGLAIIQKNS
ncbi:prephenate dehydratase domain-containing protein, partial [Marinobacter aromaticivorans]